ncbi:hypothetical protein ACFXAZ_19995 [Streptomyces sp. NPDC059477]|uniref:hypothetical protein n=1 Tax=Streptomyces sp. NPDC059477 TaxID=3346847 RepID=UPI0036C1E847
MVKVLDGEPRFHLWVRPAPPRGESVRAWVYDGVEDQRRHPLVKGPDLEWLSGVRAEA